MSVMELMVRALALIGDLNYGRTIHSLAYLLTKYKVGHIHLVAPEFVQMKPELLAHFDEHGISWSACHRLKDIASEVDIFLSNSTSKGEI